MIVNKTNPIYNNAMNFIANNNGLSTIRFNSYEMKEKFEALKEDSDNYIQKLVKYIECFALTSQYLAALHGKTINKLEKLVSVAMLDSGYDEEVRAHALNILKEIWLFGSELD